jgi:hypothetical protein
VIAGIAAAMEIIDALCVTALATEELTVIITRSIVPVVMEPVLFRAAPVAEAVNAEPAKGVVKYRVTDN